MNRKGFTLVELLAVLVILSLVIGIAIPVSMKVINNTKAKSEKAFVETLRDAMDIYLSGDEKKGLAYGGNEKGYKVLKGLTFDGVIDSKFAPLAESSYVNPVNTSAKCKLEAPITIYEDSENHVYFYEFKASDLGCLKYVKNMIKDNKEYCVITNFPERGEDDKCKW